MGKLKDQLAGIAALIAAIVAIGGGFATYGKLTEKIKVLEQASKTIDKVSIEMVAVLQEKVKKLENKEVVVDLSGIESQTAVLEEKVNKLENADTSHTHELIEHEHDNKHSHTKPLVNAKEIELLKVQIEEIKVSTKNPLSN
jgi:NH3-dependent NAD+ synthetase